MIDIDLENAIRQATIDSVDFSRARISGEVKEAIVRHHGSYRRKCFALAATLGAVSIASALITSSIPYSAMYGLGAAFCIGTGALGTGLFIAALGSTRS